MTRDDLRWRLLLRWLPDLRDGNTWVVVGACVVIFWLLMGKP